MRESGGYFVFSPQASDTTAIYVFDRHVGSETYEGGSVIQTIHFNPKNDNQVFFFKGAVDVKVEDKVIYEDGTERVIGTPTIKTYYNTLLTAASL